MGRIVKLCWVVIALNYLNTNQVKAQPSNDSCADAQVLAVSSSWSYETYTYLNATSEMSGCGDAEFVISKAGRHRLAVRQQTPSHTRERSWIDSFD